MQLPRCPKCLDGGRVEVVLIPSDVDLVFQPLPEGWPNGTCELRCECGWTIPISAEQADRYRSQSTTGQSAPRVAPVPHGP
jgi:hypothetical protein